MKNNTENNIQTPHRTFFGLILFGLCLAVILSACAAVPENKALVTEPEPNAVDWPDEKLKDAFARYWGTRFSKDFADAFDMEAPHFQELFRKQRYNSFAKGTVSNTLIKVRVKKLEDKTKYLKIVHCYLIYKTPNGVDKESFYGAGWVKVNGRWYHVIHNPLAFSIWED